MFSQREEEKYILEFFGDRIGRVLDIGAYHPEFFSNSRALIDKGWNAVLVEPSPKCHYNLRDYYKDNNKVEIVPYAIGPINGPMKFYDSAGAVATALESHYKVWKDRQLDYEEIQVACMTWQKFYSLFPGKYEFISIDAEGMDYSILSQMDLNVMETELLCIEYTYNTSEIITYLTKSGFTNLIYKTGENIMVGRK